MVKSGAGLPTVSYLKNKYGYPFFGQPCSVSEPRSCDVGQISAHDVDCFFI